MLAVPTSCPSPSASWRRKEEKTKEGPRLENWRDRRGSKASMETLGNGEKKKKENPENWRVRKPETVKPAEEEEEEGGAVVYGDCVPAERQLQKMYKGLKTDNSKFTTWLVESVYPSTASLPPSITLQFQKTEDHPKYRILVNNLPDLARQLTTPPPLTITALLQRLIAQRTEYTHWMSLTLLSSSSSPSSSSSSSPSAKDSHEHYIKILVDVACILAEKRPAAPSSSSSSGGAAAASPSPLSLSSGAAAESTPDPSTTTTTTTTALGKRKPCCSLGGGMPSPERKRASGQVSFSAGAKRQLQGPWRAVAVGVVG